MFSNVLYISVIVVATITIIITSVGIVLGIRFQKKQKEKLKAIEKIVNENKDMLFQVRDSLTSQEISKVDSKIDINKLMSELYQTYLNFETKMKELDDDLDDVLTGNLKEFYIKKIKLFKKNSYMDIKDKIDLIGYAITEFKKNNLKFRININCLDYKTINGEVVRGSNVFKLEQIILLSFKKINGNWLINAYDKIYERKLSE